MDILMKLLAGQERLEKRMDSLDGRMDALDRRMDNTNSTLTLLGHVIHNAVETFQSRAEDHEHRIMALERR